MKPGKGNGVTIINRVDYKARMQDTLGDNTKFDLVYNTALRETLSKEPKITKLNKMKLFPNISLMNVNLNPLALVLVFFMNFLKYISSISSSDQ